MQYTWLLNTGTETHVCVCACACVCVYVCVFACVCALCALCEWCIMCVCVHCVSGVSCVCVCLYVGVYVCGCVCMWVCMYGVFVCVCVVFNLFPDFEMRKGCCCCHSHWYFLLWVSWATSAGSQCSVEENFFGGGGEVWRHSSQGKSVWYPLRVPSEFFFFLLGGGLANCLRLLPLYVWNTIPNAWQWLVAIRFQKQSKPKTHRTSHSLGK